MSAAKGCHKPRLSDRAYRYIYTVPVIMTLVWTSCLCFCVLAQFPAKSTPSASASGADKSRGLRGDSPAALVDKSREYPECAIDDTACIDDHKEQERLGKDAIMQLHRQMDDDHDGDVEPSESDEFLRDELKYVDDFERHTQLHRNDKRISAEELWKGWKYSEVYNWTVDRTAKWLEDTVELPQYAERFQNNGIEGSALPRLATNNGHFLTAILGILDPIHRQKISLKAMDVVLFGPPKPVHNYLKDWLLVISLVVALGGCWFAFIQHRYSQSHVRQLLREMESLSVAEDTLKELQEKLTVAEEEHKSAVREKQSIEKQLTDEIEGAKREAERLQRERNDDTIDGGEDLANKLRLAEEELVQLRCALDEAERRLSEQINWSAPGTLQQWLQLTYEIEYRYYVSKRVAAAKQLQEAKEECEKLRRKRASLIGSFRIAHGGSLDAVDHRIIKARSALHEVTAELKERTHRWNQIENLCQFAIINNPGFQVLMAGMNVIGNGSDIAGMPNSSSVVGSLANMAEYNPPMGLEECEEDLPPVPQSYSSVKALNMVRNNSQDFLHSRFAQQRTQSNQSLLAGSQVIHRTPLSQQPHLQLSHQTHPQQPQLASLQQGFASSRCATMPSILGENGTASTGPKYILGGDSTFERMSSQESNGSQLSSSSQSSQQQQQPPVPQATQAAGVSSQQPKQQQQQQQSLPHTSSTSSLPPSQSQDHLKKLGMMSTTEDDNASTTETEGEVTKKKHRLRLLRIGNKQDKVKTS